jgi:hypothetical protein
MKAISLRHYYFDIYRLLSADGSWGGSHEPCEEARTDCLLTLFLIHIADGGYVELTQPAVSILHRRHERITRSWNL